MAKLYFKYGAMGSSKTANALITKFNYEERGMRVWLIKPSIDDRDGADIIRSRIGLEQRAQVITPDMDIFEEFKSHVSTHAIIADECAIGMINNKTTAVRVIPVYGKGVGEEVEFGGLLGSAPIMPVRAQSAEKFISRGGHVPAPIHSNKN